jgi:hypothetical protein
VRTILALPALLIGGCSVDNDAANDQVRVEYNEERIEDATDSARNVARGVGNVAAASGRAIRNEIGDIDVDIDVRRNRDGGDAGSQGNGQ